MNKPAKLEPNKVAPALDTPTDLSQEAVDQVSKALNVVLADAFAFHVVDQTLLVKHGGHRFQAIGKNMQIDIRSLPYVPSHHAADQARLETG